MGICGSKTTASKVNEGVPPDQHSIYTNHQCVLTLEGHCSPVYSANFSPDGTKIVSTSGDKTVRVWSAATGECVLTLEGHSRSVVSASYSPDSTKIVSASYDETVRVWSAATGECELTIHEHRRALFSASFSPDGAKIVSASWDKTVRVWSAATGECELTLAEHSNAVHSASFSPDGEKIVSASDDETVRVWNAATGECMLVLTEHNSAEQQKKTTGGAGVGPEELTKTKTPQRKAEAAAQGAVGSSVYVQYIRALGLPAVGLYSASFSPDSTKIVSASYDKTVRVWSAATGECELALTGHSSAVNLVSFSQDGRKIVSTSSDNTVRVWNAATGDTDAVLSARQASFSPDGAKIASACRDNTVRVWSILTSKEAAKAAAPKIRFSVIELTGKELLMTTLSALHTVDELKQEVARASGIKVAQLRMVLKNEALDDENRTLGEYGVEAGSQVNAVSQSGVNIEEE